MDKFLLKNNKDLLEAINFFGKEWEEDIKNEASEYPFILIGFFADDIEFGKIYRFTSIKEEDFC